MTAPHIDLATGEAALDWLRLTDAIAAGHRLPAAQIEDVVLRRGPDTMLNRSAWIDGLGLAVKVATIFPGNTAMGKPTVGGMVSLFDDADGVLQATLDFALVTKWKTAGDSLLAARRLAPPEVRDILIVGAGTVGRSLREAYGAAFPDARYSVWNRSADAATRFVAEHPDVTVATDLAEAVTRADIIGCATMTSTPVLQGAWLRPGQHVDLIGAYRSDMREADDAVLQRGRLFVDSFDTTLAHIGELSDPLSRGVIDRADVLADFRNLDAFDRAPQDITVFKNGGGAHLDLMVARHILDAVAAADGLGA